MRTSVGFGLNFAAKGTIKALSDQLWSQLSHEGCRTDAGGHSLSRARRTQTQEHLSKDEKLQAVALAVVQETTTG